MKKLLLTALLAVLSLHSNIKAEEDLYALSYTGSIEELANMDNPLENDEIDKFLKNIPGGKLGVLGTRKLYLHKKTKFMFGANPVYSCVGTSSYISNDNNLVTVNEKSHKFSRYGTSTAVTTEHTYAKILATESQASNNKWTTTPLKYYDLKNSNDEHFSILYLKVTQNAASDHIDGGESTYFDMNTSLPLGLSGNKGVPPNTNDLYIPVYITI